MSFADWRGMGYLRTRPDSTRIETWPRTIPPSEGFNHSEVTIVKAGRNDPTDLSFHITFPASPGREPYLFIDCDTGTYNISNELTGQCAGHVNGTMGAGSQPDAETYTVRVSEPQKRPWGLA